MTRLRILAATVALAASFALGGAVTAIGLPSESQIVAGVTACVVLDKAVVLRIPLRLLPQTAAHCAATKRLWFGIAR